MGRARNRSEATALSGFDAALGTKRGSINPVARLLTGGSPDEINNEIEGLKTEVAQGDFQRVFVAVDALVEHGDTPALDRLNQIVSEQMLRDESASQAVWRERTVSLMGVRLVANKHIVQHSSGTYHLSEKQFVQANGELLHSTICGKSVAPQSFPKSHNMWYRSRQACQGCESKLTEFRKGAVGRYENYVTDMLHSDKADLEDLRTTFLQERILDHFRNGHQSIPTAVRAQWAQASYWHAATSMVASQYLANPYNTMQQLYGDEGKDLLVELHGHIQQERNLVYADVIKIEAKLFSADAFRASMIQFADAYWGAVDDDNEDALDHIVNKYFRESVAVLKARLETLL